MAESRDNLSWSELGRQFFIPILLTLSGAFSSWTAAEVAGLRAEIQGLAIQLARLQVEVSNIKEERVNR